MPGKTGLKEFLADIFEYPLHFFNIAKPLITMVAPDMLHYWNQDSEFGSNVRWRLTQELKKAQEEENDILLLSHSLGTLISYDVLWKFSYYGEYQKKGI